MRERLLNIIKDKSLTNSKLAEILGIDSSGISHIISGRNKPGYDFITRFVENFPDVNPVWFLTGNGDMYVDNSSKRGNVKTDNTEISLFEQIETYPVKTNQKEDIVIEKIQETIPVLQKIDTINDIAPVSDKQIEKIVVFYSDKTFSTYKPE